MLKKEDLVQCLRHYPHVADHIKTIAQERYNSIKMLELSSVFPHSRVHDYFDECNQNQNDEKKSKQFNFYQRIIIDPEGYVGLTILAIDHILVLLTLLILPYQVSLLKQCSYMSLTFFRPPSLILQPFCILLRILLNHTL